MSADAHPMFRWARDADGVVTITMDDPDQSANTMNERFRREFPLLVDHLHAEVDAIAGVILTSAKQTFCAGGDLDMLLTMTAERAAEMDSVVEVWHAATRRLERLGRPVVAVLNGAALGGGLELALACHHRIANAGRSTRIGLPEVGFGLLPGGGGVARTVRMLGINKALDEVLLTGRAHTPEAALGLGLVDEVLDGDERDLLAAARAWIVANPAPTQPWDTEGFRLPGGTPTDRTVATTLPARIAQLRKAARGPLLPAPRNIVAAAVEGAQVDFENALRIEKRYFVDLTIDQISTNLVQSQFFDMQAVRRGLGRPAGFEPRPVTKLVVLGAGMMGAGIAYVAATAGVEVVLKDLTLEAAEKGKSYSARLLAAAVERGRLTQAASDETLARIRPTADPADAAGADFVIEAVFEDAALKQQVIAEVVPHLASDAVVASNTSTLPITGLAHGVEAPETFIGTHFFSPVDKMPLLEVVVGAKTSESTLARTLDLAAQIGKTAIVVNDGRGFFTSRVILTFVDEALAMLAEGVPSATVEQAATQAGYPVGALTLADEVSLTLNRSIRRATAEALHAEGRTAPEHPAINVIDRMLDEFGRGGRAAGAGFYDYAEGRRTGLWPGLAEAFKSEDGPRDLTELQERLLFAESLEALRCLDEGVLRSVEEANVGSILGIGFPAWTGGVLQYVDQYPGGTTGFAARAQEFTARHGAHFAPPNLLLELAATGTSVRSARQSPAS